MTYWTGFNHFVIWGSIVFYFAFILVFYSNLFGYSYQGTAVQLMSTASYWLTILLTAVLLLAPVVLFKLYFFVTQPTLADRIRSAASRGAPRKGPRVLRRASTMQRSQRSIRTGYAFAHEGGYGELITTGSMMTLQKRPASARVARHGTARGGQRPVNGQPTSSQAATTVGNGPTADMAKYNDDRPPTDLRKMARRGDDGGTGSPHRVAFKTTSPAAAQATTTSNDEVVEMDDVPVEPSRPSPIVISVESPVDASTPPAESGEVEEGADSPDCGDGGSRSLSSVDGRRPESRPISAPKSGKTSRVEDWTTENKSQPSPAPPPVAGDQENWSLFE